MSRLKFYFTNDVKSTSLKGIFYEKHHEETTNEIDTTKKIRKVSLKIVIDGGPEYITGIKFLAANDEVVSIWEIE